MCKYWQYHFRTLVAFCTENCMQTAQSSHVLGGPAILLTSLAPLPTLNKANYANVRFWTKSSYTEYQKKYKGDTNVLATRKQWWGHQPKGDSKPGTDIVTWYSFLEDINGNLVPAKCLNLISIKSRQCWFSLLRAGHAPAKWRAKDDAASAYYRHEMESKFIEFCFGANGWKLEKYASLNYSLWYTHHVKSKVANSDSNDDKEEPEADNNEEELQDDEDDNSDPESTRRPQKQHHQSSPTLDETDLFQMTPSPSEEPPSSIYYLSCDYIHLTLSFELVSLMCFLTFMIPCKSLSSSRFHIDVATPLDLTSTKILIRSSKHLEEGHPHLNLLHHLVLPIPLHKGLTMMKFLMAPSCQ